MTGNGDPSGRETDKTVDLGAALRRARERQAERGDVVVDMAHAARARLELLSEDLQPLTRDVPADVDLFDFGISAGETPRLWIDAVAHVRMGRDRRVYEFVQDTRNGRVLLASGEDRAIIAAGIADYVAGRILERERARDSAVPLSRSWQSGSAAYRPIVLWLAASGLVLFGVVIGAAAMFLLAWFAV
jgi:hypothetical protein